MRKIKFRVYAPAEGKVFDVDQLEFSDFGNGKFLGKIHYTQDDERRQFKLALRDPEVIKQAVRGAIEDQRRIMGLYIYPDPITNPSNLTNKLYIVPVVDILKFQWEDER